MKTYLAGTPIKLAVSFTDTDGNVLSVSSATYTISDDRSNVILGKTEFNPTSDTIVIDAELNHIEATNADALTSEQIDEVRLNEARIVEFELTLDDGNIYPFDIAYILRPRERLIAGLNSFQTLRESYLNSMSIPSTAAWMLASEDERVAAMELARLRICSFRFSDVTLGQSYLSEEQAIADLSRLPPKDFKALTARFKKALALAQLAEAEEILGGGDQVSLMRRNGLTSQTIGETQETYRAGKTLDMQLSKVALRYLSPFISLTQKIGRAG